MTEIIIQGRKVPCLEGLVYAVRVKYEIPSDSDHRISYTYKHVAVSANYFQNPLTYAENCTPNISPLSQPPLFFRDDFKYFREIAELWSHPGPRGRLLISLERKGIDIDSAIAIANEAIPPSYPVDMTYDAEMGIMHRNTKELMEQILAVIS